MKNSVPLILTGIFVFAAIACQSPEERATGKEGQGRTDSSLNSQPLQDVNSKPGVPDSTNFTDSMSANEMTDTSAVKDRKQKDNQ